MSSTLGTEDDRAEILQLLVNIEGVDVNVLHYGQTPADAAAMSLQVNAYSMLCKKGGKIHSCLYDRITSVIGISDNPEHIQLRDMVKKTTLIDPPRAKSNIGRPQ
ncbi:MAG: hypothetical protein LBQ43_00990 [Holosporales bacterium]|nr:hypothetical protein [Holosporales bacterium]